ncbi:Uncharacterised protein [Mycolicibacterium aichiense]|nr:Uncharacterised protein [Mycolicibacterium aichiense]
MRFAEDVQTICPGVRFTQPRLKVIGEALWVGPNPALADDIPLVVWHRCEDLIEPPCGNSDLKIVVLASDFADE